MKNRRILVSVAMLLLSAVLLSSASFAWFSMNTTVEVDGIEFEAYSDSLFLEISATSTTAGFSPNDITVENGKKTLRPVAYGTIDALGTIYTVDAELIDADDAYYVDNRTNYYKLVNKGNGNDTKVTNPDYICINDDELYLSESVSGLYLLGEGGANVRPITDPDYTGVVLEKKGNDYVQVTNYTSPLGYYYIERATALGNANYEHTKQYYAADEDADGNIIGLTLVGGLNAGSHLKGYYTLELTTVDVDDIVVGREYYFMNSDYDLVAFKASADEGEGLDGYWYRGYSENINPDTDNKDADADNITGVIDMYNKYNNETTPYYLYDEFYIRMAEGSANATNLRISKVDVKGSDDPYALTKAIRVIFVCSSSAHGQTARILYNHEDGTFTNLDTGATSALIDGVLIGNTGEVITVSMYVYYDGTHESVATHDALNLSGHSISVGFEIDKPEYAN